MKFLSEILRLTLIVQDIRGQTYFADKVVKHVHRKTCAIFSQEEQTCELFLLMDRKSEILVYMVFQ